MESWGRQAVIGGFNVSKSYRRWKVLDDKRIQYPLIIMQLQFKTLILNLLRKVNISHKNRIRKIFNHDDQGFSFRFNS